MKLLPLFLTLLLSAQISVAQEADFLTTSGPLSDEDFYRLVSCRAYPGKPCQQDLVRWPSPRASALRVGIRSVAEGYPSMLQDQLDGGLDLAIRALNEAGGNLTLLREREAEMQDISIHLISSRTGEPIRGTGNPEMDGLPIGAALVHIRWNGYRQIEEATIAMASDLPLSMAYPVLLEELTQALGLMTDIRNPHYDRISVFSEDSNIVTKLGEQDRAAIRRHYPAE